MFSGKVLVALMLLGVAASVPSDLYSQQTYEEPIPYQYSYNVRDPYAGADFGHSEDSDGHNARGSFHVQLPDGRRQTVNYNADHQRGFVADVQYEGEAQYAQTYGPAVTFKPSQQNSYQPPAPAPYH
ncbi:pro-resilin-like [Penaeus japonicus]|uniref:pro-resilin-like n=1 Tax=Penaeus japonicus TaxID=27405 RepID=UPI001C713C1C|nr:pro-resilin-like [Penaeus japonicus]